MSLKRGAGPGIVFMERSVPGFLSVSALDLFCFILAGPAINDFLYEITGKVRSLSQRLVPQVGIALGHLWAFVGEQFLQGV